MKAIFVQVANRPECINALNVAFNLADTLEANVVGCHIRDHRDSDTVIKAYKESSLGLPVMALTAGIVCEKEYLAVFPNMCFINQTFQYSCCIVRSAGK